MTRKLGTSVVVAWGVLIVTAGVGAAQPRAAPAAIERAEQLRLRYQLQVMERILEQAVQHGAQIIGARLQVAAPDLLLFAGPARARGFRLEGFGLFFDVEVPALRESLTWSFRVLRQPDVDLSRTLERLKQLAKLLRDDAARANLEQELARLELRVRPPGPFASAPPAPAGSVAAQAAIVAPDVERRERPLPPAPPPPLLDDPVAQYTAEVQQALVDAMLDHGGHLTVAHDEWLVVAARDAEGLAPGDLSAPPTILLRIRGADLAAFRAGQLSREEARKRVEVREF